MRLGGLLECQKTKYIDIMREFVKLTPAEMQMMNILWDMPDGGCAWDVLEYYDEPKPAYSTAATLLKILAGKGFVESRKGQGKTLIYTPLISRENYTRREMNAMKQNLFGGSLRRMVRFFMQEEELTAEEIQELMSREPEG